MSEIVTDEVNAYRDLWESLGQYGRLEVSRSRYDDAVVSWEVLWPESGFCDVPVAEFTTWLEAQSWATTNARQCEKCSCQFIKGEVGSFAWSDPNCPAHRGISPDLNRWAAQ